MHDFIDSIATVCRYRHPPTITLALPLVGKRKKNP